MRSRIRQFAQNVVTRLRSQDELQKQSPQSLQPLSVMLHTLEDRVLYSAVPLPVDLADIADPSAQQPAELPDATESLESSLESSFETIGQLATLEDDLSHDLGIGDAPFEETDSFADDASSMEPASGSALPLEETDPSEASEESSNARPIAAPVRAQRVVAISPNTGSSTPIEEGDYVIFNDQSLSSSGLPDGETYLLSNAPDHGNLYGSAGLISAGDMISVEELRNGEILYIPDHNLAGSDQIELTAQNVSFDYTLEVVVSGTPDDGTATIGDQFTLINAPATVTANYTDPLVVALSNGNFTTVVSPAGTTFAVAAYDDGGYIVAQHQGAGANSAIFVHRVNNAGDAISLDGQTTGGAPVLITAANLANDHPAVTTTSNGGFAVAYTAQAFGEPVDESNVVVKFFSADGSEFKETIASTATNWLEQRPEIVELEDGRIVVAWSSESDERIYASILTPNGDIIESRIRLEKIAQDTDFALTATKENGFAVVYQDKLDSKGKILGSVYDSDGNKVGRKKTLQERNTDLYGAPDIAVLGDGSFVVAYNDDFGSGQSIQGRRFDSNFRPIGEAFALSTATGAQGDVSLAVFGNGQLAIANTSFDGTTTDVVTQRAVMSQSGFTGTDTNLGLTAGLQSSAISVAGSTDQETVVNVFLRDLPAGTRILVDGAQIGQSDGVNDVTITGQPMDRVSLAPANASVVSLSGKVAVVTSHGGAQNEVVSDFNLGMAPVSASISVSGRVVHDDEIDGFVDGDDGFVGGTVYLFEETSPSSFTHIVTTTTDNDGRYTFSNLVDGTNYIVAVDSRSLTLAGSTAGAWAQQTYASAGAITSTFSFDQAITQTDGFFIGGRDLEKSDALGSPTFGLNALTGQHANYLTASATDSSILNIDFGFNFNVVNHLSDTPEAIQGSLRQFITNANAIAGENEMVFVPTTAANEGPTGAQDRWKIDLASVLPAITDDLTIIDGRAWSTGGNTHGHLERLDLNPGTVPSVFTGDVGVAIAKTGAATQPTVTGTETPDLEITSTVSGLTYGLMAQATDANFELEGVAFRNVSVYGFGDGTDDSANIIIDGRGENNGNVNNVSSFELSGSLIGVGGTPVFSPTSNNQSSAVLVYSASGIAADQSNRIFNNVIANSDSIGIRMREAPSAFVPSTVVNWAIDNNVITNNGLQGGDGIDMAFGTSNISLTNNYIYANKHYGIDTFYGGGNFTIVGNTIQGNGTATEEAGGIRLYGNSSTVSGNIISGNLGAGVNISSDSVGKSAAIQNRITVNEFSGNSGIGIDLAVDSNDAATSRRGDGITLVPGRDTTTGNEGIDSPEISSVSYINGQLQFRFAATGTLADVNSNGTLDGNERATIEVYYATPGTGDSAAGVAYGEGSNFVASIDASQLVLDGANWTVAVDQPAFGWPVANFTAADTFTAIAIDTQNNTSEFSANRQVNFPPTLATIPLQTVLENNTTSIDVLTLGNASDPDGNPLAPVIVGGADAALFSIDGATNQLVLNSGYTIAGSGPVDLQVDIAVDDGNGAQSAIQSVVLRVLNINDAPTLNAIPMQTVLENNTTSIDVLALGNASDQDGDPLTPVIVGGADAALFSIDGATNQLVLNSGYTISGSNDADLQVEIAVEDGNGGQSATQTVVLRVQNVNDAPTFSAIPMQTVLEDNTTSIDVLTLGGANDQDGNPLTPVIVGGADAALFSIDGATNQLVLNSGYTVTGSAPVDLQVDIAVDDGNGAQSAIQSVVLRVLNINDAPTLNAIPMQTVLENNTTSIDVLALGNASDQDGDPLTPVIVGGADAALFSIDGATNQLVLNSGYTISGSNDADLQVEIAVEDGNGGQSATQTVVLRVQNVNDAPTFSAIPMQTVLEDNTTSIDVLTLGGANDQDGNPLTPVIVGGADAALFSIDGATNQLVLNSGYTVTGSAPVDLQVDIAVDDGNGAQSAIQSVVLRVLNINDAPTLNAIPMQTVLENNTTSIDVLTLGNASDQDGDALTPVIVGGTDAALFSIDGATNQLVLNSGYTISGSNDADLQVEIAVEDGNGGQSATQTVVLRVQNVNDVPTLTPIPRQTVLENATTSIDLLALGNANDQDGDSLTPVIVGGADAALFSIDGATNQLVLNNGYTLTGAASIDLQVDIAVNDGNGGQSATQTVVLRVQNNNDTPSLSTIPPQTVLENATTSIDVLTLGNASDQDGDALTPVIVGGADAALFSIDGATNELVLNSGYTITGSAPVDLRVDVAVEEPNGLRSLTQTVVLSVQNINDAPTFSAIPMQTVLENDTTSIDVLTLGNASDQDGDALSPVIVGGADASLFSIDGATNQLVLNSGYSLTGSAPVDLQVDIAVEDPNNAQSTSQTVVLRVQNVNDAPTLNVIPTQTVLEYDTTSIDAVTLGNASDQDGDALRLVIVGGTDAGLFSIDAAANQLVLNSGYTLTGSTPVDLQVDIAVDDGNGAQSAAQPLVLRVQNVNDAPTLTAIPTQTVLENDTTSIDVLTLGNASDQDGDALTPVIVGGADAGLFSIDGATNQLVLNSGYAITGSTPVDLQVDIAVTDPDGVASTSQTVVLSVQNVNDAPTLSAIPTQTVLEYDTTSIDAVTLGNASDQDGDGLTLIIVGGADAGQFSIDGATNQLVLNSGYTLTGSIPVDLQVNVAVDDGNGLQSAAQTVVLRVQNVNDAPTLSAIPLQTVLENDTTSIDVLTLGGASDQDNDTLTPVIVGGSDAGLFSIDGATNQLVLNSGYALTGSASVDLQVDIAVDDPNGLRSTAQTLVLRVQNVNDAPALSAIPLQTVFEDATTSIDVMALGNASDLDGDAMTVSIVGGVDASLFSIDVATNELVLNAPYPLTNSIEVDLSVDVAVDDGNTGQSGVQTVVLRVLSTNSAPTLSPIAQQFVSEYATMAFDVLTLSNATDLDGDNLTVNIVGGPNAALFSIDPATQELVLNDGYSLLNGVAVDLQVDIAIDDGNGLQSAVQPVVVGIVNVNDAPVFDSTPAEVIATELSTAVTVLSANDLDGDTLVYSLTDAEDNQYFEIDPSTGELTFKALPTFQFLGIRGKNPFTVEIQVDDQNSAAQAPVEQLNVVVGDFREPPTTTTDTDTDTDVPTSTVDPNQIPATNSSQTNDQPTGVSAPPPQATQINDALGADDVNYSSEEDESLNEQSLANLSIYEWRYDVKSSFQNTELLSQQMADIYRSRRSSEIAEAATIELATLFWQELDSSNEDYLQKSFETRAATIITASASLLSLSFAGLLYGSGVAITTLATQIPAWKALDISPLISAFDEDEETIHQIVDG